LLISRYISFTW